MTRRRNDGPAEPRDPEPTSAGGPGDNDDGPSPKFPPSPPPPRRWPVALFVPNLLGYLRAFLSFRGLRHALRRRPREALRAWTAAASLDLLDGAVARGLDQCSEFGVLLDIAADNVLRTTVWISAIVEASRSHNSTDFVEIEICAWAAVVCLEWITMFCSQNSQRNDSHWKDVNGKNPDEAEAESCSSPPFWVRAVFKNNFRSPAGMLAIYGLFVAPLGTYVWYADWSTKSSWPWLLLTEEVASWLIWASYVGRLLSAGVEVWICHRYLASVIARDERQGLERKEGKHA
ncbi:hypothetical protein ACHAWF_009774 [Thalassiosira exigua]